MLTNKQKSLLKSSVQVKPSPAKNLMASKTPATISVPRGTCDKLKASFSGNVLTLKQGCSSTTVDLSSITPAGDIFLSSVVSSATPGIYTGTLNNGSTFNIDLTGLLDANDGSSVSVDVGNLITTGADNGAYLNEAALATAVDNLETLTTLVYSEPNATDWGLEYTDEDGVSNFIKLNHREIASPTMNTALTITHGLNSTRVNVETYEVATWMSVVVQYGNRTANTIDIISTTWDQLEVIISK